MEYQATEQILVELAKQLVIDNKNISKDVGIYVKIDVSAGNYGYEKDGNTYHEEWERHEAKVMHYIITKPHNVFLAVTSVRDSFGIPSPDLFKNTSNHNSCWSTSGFKDLFSEVMEVYDACYSHMPAEHKKCPAMANIRTAPSFLSGWLFKFVYINKTRLKDGYHCKIDSIQPLNYEISLSAE